MRMLLDYTGLMSTGFYAGLSPIGRGRLNLSGEPGTSGAIGNSTYMDAEQTAQNDRVNHLIILQGEQPWQQQQYRLKKQRQAPGTARPWTFSRSPSVF